MCSSLIGSSNWGSLLSLIKSVWIVPLESVPSILLCIFIFFGSLSLSVQSNKSSIILIPVIILSGLNFKVSLKTSTKTGVIELVVESYSTIKERALLDSKTDRLSIVPSKLEALYNHMLFCLVSDGPCSHSIV